MTGLFVVTGASSGIGRALALRLAAPGVTLVLVARRCAELDATAAAVVARGGTPHVQSVDLSDPDAARAAALECLTAWGVPDAVFANAGLSIRRSVLETNDRPDTLTRTIGINYTGAVAHLLPFAAAMAERGRGVLVGVSSAPARLPGPGWAAYTASKAAFDSWLRSAAIELAGSGVRVVTVAFGLVRTPMSEPTYGRRPPFSLSADAAAARVLAVVAGRRRRYAPWWVRPAEIVAALAPGLTDRLAGLTVRRTPQTSVRETDRTSKAERTTSQSSRMVTEHPGEMDARARRRRGRASRGTTTRADDVQGYTDNGMTR